MVKILRITGYDLHPDDKRVNNILKAIEKNAGACVCHHEEWDENTMFDDKCCPCKTYREGKGCHCGLYLKIHN